MMKYRKKPIVIEAIKYERDHIGRMQDFCDRLRYNPHDNEYYVDTLEGCMKVADGDFIIKGVNGEFYPCKADIFHKTYEDVPLKVKENVVTLCGHTSWTSECPYCGSLLNVKRQQNYCSECGQRLKWE